MHRNTGCSRSSCALTTLDQQPPPGEAVLSDEERRIRSAIADALSTFGLRADEQQGMCLARQLSVLHDKGIARLAVASSTVPRSSDDSAEPESPNFVPQSAKDLAARNFERVNLRAETARDPYTAEEWADARIRARACETESPSFRDDLVTAFKAGRASAATAEKREPIEAMVERFFNENPGCEGYQHVINQLVTDVTVDWFEYGWKCAEEHAEWQRRPTATAAASVAKSPTRERCGAFTPVTLYCDRPEDHDGDHRFVETFTGNERLVHRRERDQPQQGAMDLSEALDLLEELASSDYDMPSHNDTMDRVDVFLAKHGRTA